MNMEQPTGGESEKTGLEDLIHQARKEAEKMESETKEYSSRMSLEEMISETKDQLSEPERASLEERERKEHQAREAVQAEATSYIELREKLFATQNVYAAELDYLALSNNEEGYNDCLNRRKLQEREAASLGDNLLEVYKQVGGENREVTVYLKNYGSITILGTEYYQKQEKDNQYFYTDGKSEFQRHQESLKSRDFSVAIPQSSTVDDFLIKIERNIVTEEKNLKEKYRDEVAENELRNTFGKELQGFAIASLENKDIKTGAKCVSLLRRIKADMLSDVTERFKNALNTMTPEERLDFLNSL